MKSQQGLPMKEDSPADRRVFYRLDDKLNLRYWVIKSPQKISGEKNSLEQLSVLKNISAGGILFVAFQYVHLKTILDINLELLDTDEPIKCLVKIVRIKEIEKDKTYEIGACFLDLSSADRTRLLKYVKGKW